jgi:hypothetical protein
MKLRNYGLCLTALLIGVGPASAQCGTPTRPLANVTIRIIDRDGRAVYWQLHSFVSHDQDVTAHFHGLRGTDIPYGLYDYSVERVGSTTLSPVKGRVFISRPEYLLVITLTREQLTGLSIDGGPVPGFVIRGRLEPPPAPSPSGEPLWIRLKPMFLSIWPQVDVGVEPSGEFRIYEPLDGPYLLTIIRGEEVLHIQPMSFEQHFQAGSFVVRMPDQSPQVISVRPDKN